MSGYYRTVLNAIPMPIFVVEEDMVILDFNLAAGTMLSGEAELCLQRRGGEALHCLHSYEEPGGCGRARACRDCIMRNSVRQALGGYAQVRQRTRMELLHQGRPQAVDLLVTAAPLEHQGQQLALLILEDVGEVPGVQDRLTATPR
jgi:PAS domain-containing protein